MRNEGIIYLMCGVVFLNAMESATDKKSDFDISEVEYHPSVESCISVRDDVSFCKKSQGIANSKMAEIRSEYNYYGLASCEKDNGSCDMKLTSAGIEKFYPSVEGFIVYKEAVEAKHAFPVLSTDKENIGLTYGGHKISTAPDLAPS